MCPSTSLQAAVLQQEAVATMQAQVAEQEAANAERQEMLQEHESRVASLKVRTTSGSLYLRKPTNIHHN